MIVIKHSFSAGQIGRFLSTLTMSEFVTVLISYVHISKLGTRVIVYVVV